MHSTYRPIYRWICAEPNWFHVKVIMLGLARVRVTITLLTHLKKMKKNCRPYLFICLFVTKLCFYGTKLLLLNLNPNSNHNPNPSLKIENSIIVTPKKKDKKAAEELTKRQLE